MLNRLSHTQLLRYAGLFTWAVLGIPLFVFTWYLGPVDGDLSLGRAPRAAVAVGAYLAFGLIYWLITHALGRRRSRPRPTSSRWRLVRSNGRCSCAISTVCLLRNTAMHWPRPGLPLIRAS